MKKLPNNEERKNKIINLLENDYDRCMGDNFYFSITDKIVQYLAIKDKDFALQLIETIERLNIF
jgi:hypothetical protein